MKRKIIKIDSSLCDGCGICVSACHEGAIALVDEKAVLLRDDYCDGLGDCLPTCPRKAISFIEKDTLAFDEAAVKANMIKNQRETISLPTSLSIISPLSTWPIQLALAPIKSDVYTQCNLLIAADCSAFAYENFHHDFLRGHVALIACPKLDNYAYQEKLKELFSNNDIAQIQIVRMEVPCCAGIQKFVEAALHASGKQIPYTITTISRNGKII